MAFHVQPFKMKWFVAVLNKSPASNELANISLLYQRHPESRFICILYKMVYHCGTQQMTGNKQFWLMTLSLVRYHLIRGLLP
jgi:hypothetical protein